MSTQHPRLYELGFSLNKQVDFITPVATAKINKLRSLRSLNPIKETDVRISDRQWFGKGHTFPTFSDRVQKSYQIAATERSATNLEALFAVAYVMGEILTTQPNSSTKPNEYQHVITWQDLATAKTCLYTSLLEKFGAEYEKLVIGVWLNSFTLTGDRNDHVKLSWEGGAREVADSVVSMPDMTTASFFKTLYGTLAFGAVDAPVDISATVLSWNITVNQNPQPMYLMGNCSGDEMLLSEILIGDQTCNGSVTIKLDKTIMDYFRGQTTCELSIVCKSPDIIDVGQANQHTMTIRLPNLVISDEGFGEEGSCATYTFSFNEDSVLKGTSDEHLQITINTNIGTTELLVASS